MTLSICEHDRDGEHDAEQGEDGEHERDDAEQMSMTETMVGAQGQQRLWDEGQRTVHGCCCC